MKRLDHYWYSKNIIAILLLPLAGVFMVLAALRRFAYRAGVLRTTRIQVPVVVIGNITVGGTGKTPLVIWLAQQLSNAGFNPGVVSRGYGAHAVKISQQVTSQSDPALVGDEPVLIATQAACPVAVDVNRVAAARLLVEQRFCNVIICDDGLQHYALERDIEIAVVDAARGWGNGWYLPAGPMRESVARLESVDFVVYQGGPPDQGYVVQLEFSGVYNLHNPEEVCSVASFATGKVHAVAGIGYPARFFAQLRDAGLEVIEHPFVDHHRYVAEDLNFKDQLPVLMTEKDAVKCRVFVAPQHPFMWVVKTQIRVEERLAARVIERLNSLAQEPGNG